MSCIKWRWVAWIIRIIGVILFIIGAKNAETALVLLAFIGVIMVLISARISINRWKCPHCELPLKENMSIFTQYCPYCGESLDE